MKAIQQVKTKLNTKRSIDVAGIIKQIEKYDVVSFDIFDTLLKRNVKKPTDIFRYMEKKYQKEGFFNERIDAEKRARARAKKEITLKKIYEEMNFDFSKEELETESELLIRNDWIMPVYKKAIQSKIVIVTSDMYLPEDFIIQILKREKLEGYKKLYLSSAVGKTKSSGADTLFQGLSETGLTPKLQDIRMFGDFRFFDEGETQYLAKPKNIFFYMIHLKTLKTDFLSSRWKIGFMKRLFKINLPYESLYKIMLKYK